MSVAILLLAAAEPQQTQPPPEKPKLICRESDQQLGSHIRTGRRCKTEDEWRQEDERLDRIPPTMRVTPGQGDGIPRPPRPGA